MMVALRGVPSSELPIPDAETLLKSYSERVGRSLQKTEWTAAVSFAFFRVPQNFASSCGKGND